MSATDRRFRGVYFDCDSTLSAIEGIDELGQFADDDVRQRLVALTADAMDGRRALRDVYQQRLELLSPTRAQLDAIAQLYIARRVGDAADVVAALQHLGVEVGIVSGGLLPAVERLADYLGIARERVHAVPIRFDAAGQYAGFDRSSPLSRNDGKREVLAALPRSAHPLCFVGDGVTDLEARDAVELFVGFGGVTRREIVEQSAEHYLEGPGLARLLDLVLTPDQLAALAAHDRFANLVPG